MDDRLLELAGCGEIDNGMRLTGGQDLRGLRIDQGICKAPTVGGAIISDYRMARSTAASRQVDETIH